MRLIEQEEAAKRLARVILSDIEIYHAQKIRSPADLKPELDEGYALFRSRVAPALVPIFSEVVADRFGKAAAKAPASERSERARLAMAHEATVTSPLPPPPREPAAPVVPVPPVLRREPSVARPAPVAAVPPVPRPEPSAARPAPDTREAARRLARVMAARIQVSDRDDCGVGLAREIEEARTQFVSCVLPELAPLFDQALIERGLVEDPIPTAAAQFEAPAEPTDRVPAPDVLPDEPSSRDGFEEMPTIARPSLLMAPPPERPAPVAPARTPPPAPPRPASTPPPPPPLAARVTPPRSAPTALPVPQPPLPRVSEPPAWALTRGRLAAAALAIAMASAGIVYILLTR